MHTLIDPLKRALQIGPNEIALIHDDIEITYADLWRRCSLLVGGLRSRGAKAGDRIAILANNSHQYVETYIGVPAGGMVVVPLNTRHALPELVYALKDSGANILLTDRTELGELTEMVDEIIRLPSDYEDMLEQSSEAVLGEDPDENALAGLFYTGGTTGASKGVMLTHRNLIANTHNWLAAIPQSSEDRTLIMAPMFHAAGSNGILGAIWLGSCQISLAAFDPKAALDLIEKHSVNITLGVPTMLAALAEEQHSNPRKTDTLEIIAHGGSPIATEVIRRTSSAFPTAQMIEVYGATELSPLATILGHEERLVDDPRARSCGRSAIGNIISICDPEGNELPVGEVGEVVVAGTNVMKGYWKKEEQTEAVLINGSYWTGDLGYLDAAGYLYLVDRSKDMIVSGGENVYSTEVEEVLYKHPAVLEAAAFGVPDEKWGEAVHAVVVPREEHNNVDPAEIVDFCRDHIAGYKVPKGIDIQHEPLPKSGPGKVLKRELRAPYWESSDRSVN
ncbi:MAG TPA: AMP-binding protein [Pseudomonadales bacterium]|jgi:long-chain acyl-CoA synthetase|nr:AMP-binding protein [Pseudomonadales bacterium]MDP6314803.1 AMP-binding protein [Pseudomonadales bacterium]MDP7315437.1 AMP-binding protein [Pseudomonadales bacterium]MDP7450892.1 AMP-binding protein [Arenicellales bacterium]HJP51079.1 AMP-binding protein [Pseudomonadales bacterium]|tara:strand:+ start:2772 stop:4289 length:1518 start_codon:yes stop_codon:yes gene_type:complete